LQTLKTKILSGVKLGGAYLYFIFSAEMDFYLK